MSAGVLRSRQPDQTSRLDALMFVDPFSQFAVLHVFEFETRKCVRTITGFADDLRKLYAEQFRILTFGVCQVCGAQGARFTAGARESASRAREAGDSVLVKTEGSTEPIWVNDEHTLCSACALGLMEIAK